MAVVIFQVLLWLLGKRNIAKHVIEHSHKGSDYTLEERVTVLFSCYILLLHSHTIQSEWPLLHK